MTLVNQVCSNVFTGLARLRFPIPNDCQSDQKPQMSNTLILTAKIVRSEMDGFLS